MLCFSAHINLNAPDHECHTHKWAEESKLGCHLWNVQSSEKVVTVFAGIPLDVLSGFPVLKAHHARMANFPAIATYYKTKNNPKRIGFTADAA